MVEDWENEGGSPVDEESIDEWLRSLPPEDADLVRRSLEYEKKHGPPPQTYE